VCGFAAFSSDEPRPLLNFEGSLYFAPLFDGVDMAITAKPGQTVRVTISKHIKRDAAVKTLERLFLQDKTVSEPIETRSRNFKDQPKRRGGQIWTKRPNKVHPSLIKGAAATIKATPQSLKDLASVEDFITVSAK
jgi:hypothetical protein